MSKPRIKWLPICRAWACMDAHRHVGYGTTPAEAYREWEGVKS